MLISLFRDVASRNVSINEAVTVALLLVVAVFFSLSVHECCHALAAYALGDPTAKSRGRLTLNPIKHLNPIGAICMLLMGFGWANPVPVNPNYFKKRKVGMAITAFAGPLSNLLLSFISLIIYALIWRYAPHTLGGFGANLLSVVITFFRYMHILNINLAVFNLIPIPPLDGSRILNIFLPEDKYFKVMRYEQYLAVALIVLLYIGVLDGPLSFITGSISDGMFWLVRLFIK